MSIFVGTSNDTVLSTRSCSERSRPDGLITLKDLRPGDKLWNALGGISVVRKTIKSDALYESGDQSATLTVQLDKYAQVGESSQYSAADSSGGTTVHLSMGTQVLVRQYLSEQMLNDQYPAFNTRATHFKSNTYVSAPFWYTLDGQNPESQLYLLIPWVAQKKLKLVGEMQLGVADNVSKNVERLFRSFRYKHCGSKMRYHPWFRPSHLRFSPRAFKDSVRGIWVPIQQMGVTNMPYECNRSFEVDTVGSFICNGVVCRADLYGDAM